MRGELSQKAMTGPSGTPLERSAAIRGMTPQEQIGTTEPMSAAARIAVPSFRAKTLRILSEKPETVTQAESATLAMKKGRIERDAFAMNVR
jgi:hypothetical protein